MKRFVLFVMVALAAMMSQAAVSTTSAVPTASDLSAYYQHGQVCVCIRFEGRVCNDIVWAGSYNGWGTSPDQMVHFQPLSGFDGWYVAAFSDASNDIMGKVIQLKDDGSFDWQYQNGNAATWTIHSGSAAIMTNEHGESQFEQIDGSQPLIATSAGWKNDICPSTTPAAVSGTLPVLYINTQNREAVTSKDYYLTATYYLDNLGLSGYTSIASAELPDTMQIKGRGNWTWNGFDKKPYRLKLGKKQGLMGLKKNKHFGLLAGADDQFCWVKNTMGYLLSRQLGLEWTPSQAPVEVVLNGDYIGLYMLTELIRVDKDRVNIVEQADNLTDEAAITGGWLVEIDNYAEPGHVTIYEPQNQWHGTQEVWVTPKTPELLSQAQSSYLYNQMSAINTALYANDSSASLEQLLDIEEAARYYIVQELMSDCESYHGSCYLHKDQGDGAKWKFGPVWDFGNSFNDRDQYIYDRPFFSQVWIGQLASHPVFQDAVSRLWKHWAYYDAASVDSTINAFATQIAGAAVSDAARWPQYNHADVAGGKNQFLTYFHRHTSWLTQQWGPGEADPITGVDNLIIPSTRSTKRIVSGRLIIERDGRYYDLTGRKL